MMSNTYPNSIISVRTSFYFNGYSYYPNERCPPSYFTCSCSIPLNNGKLRVSKNPNSLYGLRQSTLIQLPPSRRLILGSGYRSPGYSFCGQCCCVNQERTGKFVEKSCEAECCVKKKSVRVRVNEVRSRLDRSNYSCSALGDVDGMIDLLMGNSIEERKIVAKRNDVSERFKKRVENLGLEGENQEMQRIEEIKVFSRDEDRRSSRGESSSSYHSVLDSGDFESDVKAQTKHGRIDGVPWLKHDKGPRKPGGIVIREESQKNKQDPKTCRDEELQSSSTHDYSRVRNSMEWDSRNKSEKRLSEESTGVNKYHEIESVKSSFSKERLNYEEGESSSGVSFHGQSNSHIKAENQVSEDLNSRNRHEQSMQAEMNETQITCSVLRRSKEDEEEEHVVVVGELTQQMGCEYCEECGEILQNSKTETDLQQYGEVFENRKDINGTLIVQNQSESRLRGEEVFSVQKECESKLRMQEQSSTSLQTSVTEENTLKMENKSQIYGETVETHSWYGESSSRLQTQSKSEIKNLEGYSTSVISKQEEESSGKVIKEIESNKELQTAFNALQLHSAIVEINAQSIPRQRIDNEQVYLRTKVKSGDKSISSGKVIKEMKNLEGYSTLVISMQEEESSGKVIKEIESNKELRTAFNAPQLHSTNVEINRQRTDNEQVFLRTEVKSVEELVEKRRQINETNVQSESRTEKTGKIQQASFTENSLEEATVTQPSSMILISQSGVDQVNKVEIQSDLHISMISPLNQLVGKSPPYIEQPSINLLSNSNASNTVFDTIGTTVQPQVRPVSSYAEVITSERKSFKEPSPEHSLIEFVEDANHEASTSETKTENLSEKYMLERLTKSESEKTRMQKQDSRPLGKLWVVKDHLPLESSEVESFEGATSLNVVNSNGKSLWNIIARVFRLQRVSKSETQTSPVKSSSSETRASKKEPDETQQKSLAQKLISSDQTVVKGKATITKMGSLGVMRSDEITNVKTGSSSSSSSSVLQVGLLLGVVSAGANADWNFSQLTPTESSKNPSRRSKKSYSSVKIEKFDQSEGYVSSKEEQRDQSLNVRQTDVSTSEIIEVEPKIGKLKRSEQVLDERFDTWEDAYKHENEQRKVDEIFMREALVEAKKAAESWEVPVGAVLVQNGKIIARGYNLVEELRDSTAHAEIICIREGSSVLRTWRLSETTLYVTLEPCPMCAGAILQARVGTIVWGAPNKLLGADGSWIRLFPTGVEEEQRPEVTNKPAAPIHPFHPKMKIRRGVLETECAEIMQQFFQQRRRNNKKKKQEDKSEKPAEPSCLPILHHSSKLFHKMQYIFHIMFFT